MFTSYPLCVVAIVPPSLGFFVGYSFIADVRCLRAAVVGRLQGAWFFSRGSSRVFHAPGDDTVSMISLHFASVLISCFLFPLPPLPLTPQVFLGYSESKSLCVFLTRVVGHSAIEESLAFS